MTFCFWSCKDKEQPAPAEWQSLITHIPRGEVSRAAPIKIRFNEPMVSQSEVGNTFKGKLSFEPDVKGKTFWSATNELSFQPDEWLEPGFEYIGRLSSFNIAGLSSELPDYQFRFNIIKQSFTIEFEPLKPQNDSSLAIQTLSGQLTTRDIADTAAVEKVLQVTQNKTSLPIEWKHQGNQHLFTVKQIKRTMKRGEITIFADGGPIEAGQGLRTETWKIPSLKDFVVISALKANDNQQSIEVAFSDPVNASQNLDGIVRTSAQSKLRYHLESNKLKVYFDKRIAGQVQIQIDPSLQNIEGNTLNNFFQKTFNFEVPKPGVRFKTKGTILPPDSNLSISFEAVSLKGIRLRAFEVYNNNMGQFLQNNSLKSADELQRVGRYLWEKELSLPKDSIKANDWNTYHIDIKELFAKHKGKLLRLELDFDQRHSNYPCSESETKALAEKTAQTRPGLQNWDFNQHQESSGWDGWNENGYWSWSGSWRNRENPCKEEFYNPNYNSNTQVGQNFLATNLALMAKLSGSNHLHLFVNSIDQGQAVSNTTLDVFNFQNQVIGSAVTDAQGSATIKIKGAPFYVRAQKDRDYSFLKVNPNSTLSISHFDIGGRQINKGLKGYLFGERGVYRPGDTLFLSFYLEDLKKSLPQNHPLHFKLLSPAGQKVDQKILTQNLNGFYTFKTHTSADAPTGNYQGIIEVGGQRFSRYFKVETIVPNRLKIELEFENDTIYTDKPYLSFGLFSEFLHGAKANELKTDIEINLSAQSISFSRFSDYSFNDMTRSFYSDPMAFYEGRLDSEGRAEVTGQLTIPSAPAGILKANFSTRVFENSGGFSISRESKTLIPYEAFVGIKLPKGDAARNMLLTDTTHLVNIATIDPKQKNVSRNVQLKLYKINWKWWWDKTSEDLGRYASDQQHTAIADTLIKTKNGKAQWGFRVNYPQWGRYLVQACDQDPSNTGLQHCSSEIIYIDWPGWAGKARENQGGEGAAMLSLSADRAVYQKGQTAKIQVVAPSDARALLSIEKRDQVISAQWVDLQQGVNLLEVPIDDGMAPNIYASVTVIQKHQAKENDLPIRLYGVTPLIVEDEDTHLIPQLKTPDKVRPQSKLNVEVSEENDKPMTYTLAVVDEGLLGLTRHKTTDLFKIFYQKEALGVKTWDLYDDVSGAYGHTLERLIAIGGDEAGSSAEKSNKNRFPPLVKFLGPFYLKEGSNQTHSIDIPEYLGAVRVMLVAGHEGAYGSTEEEVKVKQPLMIQTLAPRLLGPGETVDLPVTVFALEPNIKTVNLSIDSKGIDLVEGSKNQLSFSTPGDKISYFKIKSPEQPGEYKITVSAKSGRESISETIHLKVRSPNPLQTQTFNFELKPRQDTLIDFKYFGIENSNQTILEASVIPQLHLEQKLEELIGFPHGCLEQTTSKAFAQLYIDQLANFSEDRQKEISDNISAGIERLKSFQNANGSFSYWPGQNSSNTWAEIYAGHFLTLALKNGYSSAKNLLDNWLAYQKTQSRTWWSPNDRVQTQTQAYRLYAMALNSKPDLSAMNRLNEQKGLDWQSANLLAMAYSLSGQEQAAQELLKYPQTKPDDRLSFDHTFRSHSRDLSIALFAYKMLKQPSQVNQIRSHLLQELKQHSFYSTQTTAWSLSALAYSYSSGEAKAQSNFNYQLNNDGIKETSFEKVIKATPLKAKSQNKLKINNNSESTLYFSLTQKGVPQAGQEIDHSQGIELSLKTTDSQGKPINSNDLNTIKLGEERIYWVEVKNVSSQHLSYLALNHPAAVGFEIKNLRLNSDGNQGRFKNESAYEYRDIRDDRLLSYFDLKPNEVKTFALPVSATYQGQFYQPAITVEDMYLGDYHATVKGYSIEIKR